MPTIQDRDISQTSKLALRHVTLHVPSVAASQADALVASVRPGYAFQIVGVQHFALSATATASYAVKIGTTAALSGNAPPATLTRGDAALSASGAALKGTATSDINVHATTDATGAINGLSVVVTLRPLGLRGEPR